MDDQQIHHEEMLDSCDDQKTIYSILANYLNSAEKHGYTVKGFLDGEENYQAFMSEFCAICRTRFIIRTSWRKAASTLPRKSRYGKEERIYWEYKSGNLEVPFSGTPFVVRSCLTKHCQYGSQYYKSTADKLAEQNLEKSNPAVKKRRNKPSKKRECPAIMHIREVVLYPDFSVDLEKMMDIKFHIRKEKTSRLVQLKNALAQQVPIKTLRRFYVSLPLPELHAGHLCGGLGPIFHPAVIEKIDSLLTAGIYEARHVRVIVHDFVKETLLKQGTGQCPYNVVLFPTDNAIADYIYLWSITVNSTVIVENDCQTKETASKEEVEGSINELMNLIQNCQNEQALTDAKHRITKLIGTVANQSPPESSVTKPPKKKQKRTARPTLKPKQKRQKDSTSAVMPLSEQELGQNGIAQIPNSSDSSSNQDHLQSKPMSNEEDLLDFMSDPVDHLTLPLHANDTEFDILHIAENT